VLDDIEEMWELETETESEEVDGELERQERLKSKGLKAVEGENTDDLRVAGAENPSSCLSRDWTVEKEKVKERGAALSKEGSKAKLEKEKGKEARRIKASALSSASSSASSSSSITTRRRVATANVINKLK